MWVILGKNVLVEMDTPPTESEGGIVLTKALEDVTTGVVRAIGTEASDQWVVGMRVMLAEFAGQPVKINTKSYVLVPTDQVIGYEAKDAAPPAGD